MRRPVLALFLSIISAVTIGVGAVNKKNSPDTAKQSPGARHGFGAAYDASTGRVLIFGGVNHMLQPTVRYNDTWAWDGDRWHFLSEGGPATRVWPALAYQLMPRRLLLFGGAGEQRMSDETWRLENSGWTQINGTVSPEPRWHFAMVTDEARRQIVLFGGVNSRHEPALVFGDTWIWDGRLWKKVAETGPAPRFGHAMAFDRNRQRVVLVGGRDRDQKPLNDTWEWNGREWKLVNVTGLTPRILHGLAF